MKVALVLALVIVLSIRPFAPVKATGNTPVYVLGVTNPADPLIIDLQGLTSSVTLLSSITGLATLRPGSILYIDGSWLATISSVNPLAIPTIVQTVLAGVPTIAVRGDPSILANSVSGLTRFQNPGLPLISEGVHVNSTSIDGITPGSVLRVISGFDYSVSAEFQWASQQLPQSNTQQTLPLLARIAENARPVVTTQDSPGPFWQFIFQLSTDSGDAFSTYGHVITTFTGFKLANTGSGTFKWFNIFANQTFTPNTQNGYRNYLETAFARTTNQTTNLFVDNGPASIFNSGGTTVTYSIGVQSGVSNATVSSKQTQSYFLKNTNLNNTSSAPNVSWTQTIDGQTAVGKLTLQTIQGFTDKVVETQPLGIQGNVSVTFATFMNGMTTSTATTGISFGIGGG